jgi:hypothetical protein
VLADSVSLQNNGGGSFTNLGTFVVVGTNTVTLNTQVPFYNFGTVVLTNGTLTLNGGGLHTTVLDVAAGATLRLGGTFTTTPGSILGGAGTILFNGGTQVFGGQFLPTGPQTFAGGTITISNTLPTAVVTNSSGTVNFYADQQFDLLVIQNGSVGGTGNLNVNGQMFWTGGSLNGTGRLVVASNAVMQVSGGGQGLNPDLENFGTVSLSGAAGIHLSRVINRPGGVMLLDNVALFNNAQSSVTNQGTFLVVGTNAVTFFSVPLYNLGSISLTNGTLMLNGTVTNTGSLAVSGTASLIFGNTVRLEPTTIFVGDGAVRFRGQVQLTSGVDFGTLTVVFENSPFISGAFGLTNKAGGTLIFNRALTVPGSLTIGGIMTVGATNITVTINGTLTLGAGATLNNPGTVVASAFVNNGGTINGNPPVVSGPAPAGLHIDQIQLIGSAPGNSAPKALAASTTATVVLKWHAAPGDQFVIQSTTDLRSWTDLPAPVSESAPGTFEAAFPADDSGVRLYRLRRL